MEAAPTHDMPGVRSGLWILGLLAIALPLLLFRLGAKDVWDASEGRPLESAREMRAQGDYLVQYTNGQVDLTKPPLYAWTTVVAFAIGGASEFAGRVPGVLASIGVLLAVFVLGRRIAGSRAGFLSAVMLLTSMKFVWQARLAELETLLALGVTWAYVAFDAAVEGTTGQRPRAESRGPSARRAWLGFGAALGFAAAVKGPIAFVLVLPGIAAYAIATRRALALRSGGFFASIAIALALCIAWPAAVVARDGKPALDTLLSYARGDNVGHLRGPLHYLAGYPLYALPWTLPVLLALRMRWARDLDSVARTRARLPLVAFVVTFVVQSLLSAKQTHYLIPTVFPMGAVLAGCATDRWLASRAPTHRFGRVLGPGTATLVVAFGVAGAVTDVPSFQRASDAIDGGIWAVGAIVVLLGLVSAVLVARRGLPTRAGMLEAALVLVLALGGAAAGWIVPCFNRQESSRQFIEAVDREVPRDARLAWTILGSHSDYLWYFSEARVSRRGIPEIRGSEVRDWHSRGMAYSIVTGPQAEAVADVADVVLRDDRFRRKDRSVVLLKSRERR